MTKVIGWVLVLVLAVTTGVTATVISAPSARAATTYVQRGSGFVALNPVRVVDTRIGTGAPAGPVGARRSIDVTVVGRAGVPAAGVGAVALNVTVTQPVGAGYLTVHPAGTPRPTASNLNFTARQTVANQVLVKVGASGAVTLYTSQQTQVVVDLAGWYPAAGSNYAPLNPSRILDTRIGVGAPSGTVPAAGTVTLQVTGRGGVPPSDVGAVVLNVTATAPRAAGFVTVFPSGAPRPTASNLNYAGGQTVAGLVLAKVGSDGAVALYTSASAHLVADVAGYFRTGSDYTGLTPVRLVDTRTGLGAARGRVAGGTSITVDLLGRGGVPEEQVSAVSLNVTATQSLGDGFVTTFPAGTTRPTASMLNYPRGRTVANSVLARPGADGRGVLYTSATTHLVVDIGGFISAPLDVAMRQPATTHVENDDAVATVDAPTAPGGTGSYSLAAGQAAPPVGDHVFLPPGGGNGGGLIGRVTSVSGATVQVVAVPLEAAFPAGHIEGSGTQDNTVIQSASRIGAKQGQTQANAPLTFPCRTGPGATIALEVDYSVRYAVDVEWGAGTASRVRVSATTSLGIGFSMDFSAKLTCSWEGPKVPGPPIGPFTTKAGPKVSFEVSGGIKAGVRWEAASYTVGVDWRAGSAPKPFGQLNKGRWSTEGPDSGDVHVELDFGPAAEFRLAGLVGVELFPRGFVALDVAVDADPWWTLSVGAKVGASLEADILFVLSVSWEFAAGVVVRVTIATGSGTTPPPPRPLTLVTTSLPAAAVDTPYAANLVARGGRTPYRWAASGLPPGLSLDTGTGELAGTPTTVGSSSVTVTVTDARGTTLSQGLALIVTEPLQPLVVPGFALKPGTVGVTQQWDLPAYGYGTDDGYLTWEADPATLPAGMRLVSGAERCGVDECAAALVGTPVSAGTVTIDLTVIGARGNRARTTKPLLVSARPSRGIGTRVERLPAAYDFARVADPAGAYALVRTDTATGATVDVLARANVPAACRRGIRWESQVPAWSPNGRYVMFSCMTDQWHLFLADLGTDAQPGRTRQLDVAEAGYTPTISNISDFRGDVNDQGDLVFLARTDLTAAAATEARNLTVDHAYTVDHDGRNLTFLPMRGYRWQVFRDVQIARNGNYLLQTGRYCNGPDGGFCDEGLVVVQANPFKSDATECQGSCVFVGTGWDVDVLTFADDGLTVMLREEVPRSNGNGTYTLGYQLALWRIAGGVTYFPRWDNGNGDMPYPVVGGALSPGGDRVYFTDNLAPNTCDLMTARVLEDGIGPAARVDAPPDGLPRTGCTRPLLVTPDGDVYADNTNTNFFPVPLGTPYEEVAGYLRLPTG